MRVDSPGNLGHSPWIQLHQMYVPGTLVPLSLGGLKSPRKSSPPLQTLVFWLSHYATQLQSGDVSSRKETARLTMPNWLLTSSFDSTGTQRSAGLLSPTAHSFALRYFLRRVSVTLWARP